MNKLFKTLILTGFGLSIVACSTSNQNELKDIKETAKIRLYGQNGLPSILTYKINEKEIEHNVGGTFSDAFKSLSFTVDNESLGIPETEGSKFVKNKNGILSKAFYREIKVPANIDVKVKNALIPLTNSYTHAHGKYITLYNHTGRSCENSITFKPLPDRNYEIISLQTEGKCLVLPLEILDNGETVVVEHQQNNK